MKMLYGIAGVLALCSMLVPAAAQAESVLWQSGTVPTLFYPADASSYNGGVAYAFLRDSQASVQYQASVTDDLGNSVCGASIPAGTKVHLRFGPHVSTDITWFGTGYDHDSPYGFWKANADPPTPMSGGYDPAWCTPESYVNTFGWHSDGAGRVMRNESHVSLDVDPPTHAITVPAGLTCGTPSADGSLDCTATGAGNGDAVFKFGKTFGHFYFAIQWDPYWGSVCSPEGVGLACPNPYYGYYSLYMDNTCNKQENVYSLNVPAQTIACPITVVDPNGNSAPKTPTLIAQGDASCVAGTPYTLRFSAADPEGDTIRYLVDWNNDGTVDQLVPSAGYLASGTEATASRTFSINGPKTVRVKAQDSKGMTSAFASVAFSCAGSSATSILGDDDSAADDDAAGGGAGVSESPDLTLRAVPSLVHPGDVVKVSWSATHVSSCTVDGTNGDVWDTIQSAPGGNSTSAIHQATIYRLRCLDTHGATLQKSVTVNILPSWEEQ